LIVALAILVILFIIDAVPLLKAKAKKDFIVCTALFAISLTMIILLFAEVKIPSTMALMDKVFRTLGLAYKP
jgi:hypothetical protein